MSRPAAPRLVPAALCGVALLSAPSAGAQGTPVAFSSAAPAPLVLKHPAPRVMANFGESTAPLDFDGDGRPDLAVGAYGEGLAYVYFGAARPKAHKLFRPDVRCVSPDGTESLPGPANGTLFGYDVAGGNFDADPADELVVGAPSRTHLGTPLAGGVFVHDHLGGPPLVIDPPVLESGRFGTSVVVGDLDGDGVDDLAVGAVHADVGGLMAGAVYVYRGPVTAQTVPLVLPNPQPVDNANFGRHLAIGDGNGDGVDDLYVTAIGNTAKAVPVAGQVFWYPGPVSPGVHGVIEDPFPSLLDLPAPRYGMHIDARDQFLAVGANRKDHSGVHDAGMGFVQTGPGFLDTELMTHVQPLESDYLGFRCLIGDFVGDPGLDFAFVSMPNPFLPQAKPYEVLIWDGDDLTGPPHHLRAIPGSADHYGNGSCVQQFLPGGREEIVLGDPTHDDPSVPAGTNVGRVVIYFR